MFLKRLKFNNYRNYESLEFEFSKNKTLFVGKNAQGKTNLLEAVYYLSALNSSRIKKDRELIKFGSEFCNISATVLKAETDVELDILINPPKNKVLKVIQTFCCFAGNLPTGENGLIMQYARCIPHIWIRLINTIKFVYKKRTFYPKIRAGALGAEIMGTRAV